jgi:hypothetical protein
MQLQRSWNWNFFTLLKGKMMQPFWK